MCLQICKDEDARDGTRELAEAIVDVLCLKCHALLELLAVDLRARAYPCALLPRTRRVGVKRPTEAELPLGKGLNSSPHVRIMGRAVALEDPGEARGVGQGPALVGVVTEAPSW